MAWLHSCIPIFICTLILLQSSPIQAQNGGRIAVNRPLTTNNRESPWLSPSGDFAFGFSKFPNNKNQFLLAIWYAKIPDTIIWYANYGNPVLQGSSIRITADQGLVLSDPQGKNIWNTTRDLNGATVDHGFMNDTGNFVLRSSSSGGAVWQSFDYHKDTLLPTQVMKRGSEVHSRRSETNFTKGRFQLRLLDDGNLVLNPRDLATGYAYGAYYVSGTNDESNTENAGDRVIYDESGDLFVQRKNGSKYELTPTDKLVPATDNYQRVTMEYDGTLIWYYHPKTFAASDNVSWSMIKILPDNICTHIPSDGEDFDSGACGYNSICIIETNQRPRCECPPNYTLIDPNDAYGSCQPNFKPDVCDPERGQDAAKDGYQLIPLQDTDWPLADYAKLEPTNEEECKSSCQNDCFCAAAIVDNTGTTCWKKKLPLSIGRRDTGVKRVAWLKVGNRNGSVTFSPGKARNKRNSVIAALLGGSVFVNFLLISAIVFGIFFVYKKQHSRVLDVNQRRRTLREYNSVHSFSYKELEEATEGFKEEIGRGRLAQFTRGRSEQEVL